MDGVQPRQLRKTDSVVLRAWRPYGPTGAMRRVNDEIAELDKLANKL